MEYGEGKMTVINRLSPVVSVDSPCELPVLMGQGVKDVVILCKDFFSFWKIIYG